MLNPSHPNRSRIPGFSNESCVIQGAAAAPFWCPRARSSGDVPLPSLQQRQLWVPSAEPALLQFSPQNETPLSNIKMASLILLELVFEGIISTEMLRFDEWYNISVNMSSLRQRLGTGNISVSRKGNIKGNFTAWNPDLQISRDWNQNGYQGY